MLFNLTTAKRLLIILPVLNLSSCANNPPEKAPITVCDSSGCSERPHDYASFDPNKAQPGDDSEGKIAALEALAEQDPKAAYDLALRFFRADGVRQDTYKSIKWMRSAAERGELQAQMALGRVYLTGLQEMGSDPGEAEKWLSITSNRGDHEASTLLAQAIAARQSQQAAYRLANQWRSTFYNYWNSGYGYYWNWGNGGWYLH